MKQNKLFLSCLWKKIKATKFSNTKLSTKLVKLGREEVQPLFNKKNYLDVEIEEALEKGFKVISFWDDSYPKSLKNIFDPPLILFLKGELNLNQNIAIVGSRKSSNYGKRYAYSFSRIISENSINVVSGMAAGIDSSAHKAAIENSDNAGIAVLGCGLNHVYPAYNRNLYQQLLANNGVLISEFGLYQKPRDYYFPRRNRIISGLSEATIVIEASIKSGSLITARLANEQGRDVLALPGPIDSIASSGTNQLISQGAKIICSEQDLIDYLEENEIGGSRQEESRHEFGLDRELECSGNKEFLDKLKQANYTVQSLSEELQIPVKSLYVQIVELELKGKVRVGISGGIEVC